MCINCLGTAIALHQSSRCIRKKQKSGENFRFLHIHFLSQVTLKVYRTAAEKSDQNESNNNMRNAAENVETQTYIWTMAVGAALLNIFMHAKRKQLHFLRRLMQKCIRCMEKKTFFISDSDNDKFPIRAALHSCT